MCFTRRRVTAILCLQPRDCPWSPGLPTRHDSSNQTFVNESEVITFPPTISGQKTFGTGLTRLLNPLHTHRSNNYCQWFCPLTPLTPSLPKTSQNLKIVREKFSQLITFYLFHFWWHMTCGNFSYKDILKRKRECFFLPRKINCLYLLARQTRPHFLQFGFPANLHILYLPWHFFHYTSYIVTLLTTFDEKRSFLDTLEYLVSTLSPFSIHSHWVVLLIYYSYEQAQFWACNLLQIHYRASGLLQVLCHFLTNLQYPQKSFAMTDVHWRTIIRMRRT